MQGELNERVNVVVFFRDKIARHCLSGGLILMRLRKNGNGTFVLEAMEVDLTYRKRNKLLLVTIKLQ